MARAVKSFSYDTVEDRELGILIDGLPHGTLSLVVREALRAHFNTERTTATLGDVYQAVKRIERKLDRGVVVGTVATESDTDQGEDAAGTEDAAANLDAWGV